ncbi:MAG: phosphoglucosamine mutase [bacterium]|nr:phosphoglucosamine mutase [Gammaproteobacteria bacterium]HIL96800.1 phosphoglucosamine mutase [Pseudomonadales bacterium]
MKKQYFGTDGIRGEVGKGPITAEFMLKLGWAAGRVFAAEGVGRILIGKDTRISGYMFESALEAGLVSAGVDVALLGPMPTPGIAYLTRTFNAQAGIVISASHNPYSDNGIKFFSGNGEKLPDEIEHAIEAQIAVAHDAMEMVASDKIGKVSRIDDAAGRYVEFCKSRFDDNYNLRGQKIVLDCANGATYHIAPSVFRELGAQITEIGVYPNGLNINHTVGSTHPEALCEKVLEVKADYGIAFDGDGDRVLMVDELGDIVDGDELLFIIAKYRQAHSQLPGGVVGTLMSNLGLERALAEAGIEFVRAAVGDRHVLSELQSRDWQLGGESSGHILCTDLTSTGDGIVSALQVIAAMKASGESLHTLKNQMNKYPQRMINVRCARDVVEKTPVTRAVKTTEEKLNGRGRVLLRPSGTEPLVRVMVEGEDPALVEELARNLANIVEKAAS